MPARMPSDSGLVDVDDVELPKQPSPARIIAERGGPAFTPDKVPTPSMAIHESWLAEARALTSAVPEYKTGKPGSLRRAVQAEGPAVAANVTAQIVQANADAINWRLRNADPANVALAPGVYWQAIANKQSDRVQQTTVEALDAVVPWLLRQTQFAGEGGAMAGARLYAIQTQNQTALAFLDALDKLDPLAQRVLLETLRNPATGGQGTIGGVTFALPGATQEEVDALKRANLYLHDTFGITQAWDEEGNTVYAAPNEDRSVDTLVALKTLFPTNPWLQETQIKGPDGWSRFLINPSDQILSVGATAALEGIELATLPITAGLPALKAVLQSAARLGVHLRAGVMQENLTEADIKAREARAEGIVGTPVDLFNEGFRYFDEGVRWDIHNTVMHLVPGGVTPETREQLEGALAGLTEFWILSKVSTTARAFKLSRTALPEVARTQLGIEGAAPSALHPLRFATDLAKRAGYELGMRKFGDVRGLVDEYRPVQEAFDSIADMNSHHTGAAAHDIRVGAIRSVFGDTIDARLAGRLADTPRGAMEEVFLDSAMNLPEKATRSAALSELVARQGRELEQLAPASLVESQMANIADLQRRATEARSGVEGGAAPDEALAQQYDTSAANLLRELDTVREQAVALRLERVYNQTELLKLTDDLSGLPIYEYPRRNAIKQFVEGEGFGAGGFAMSVFGRGIRRMLRKTVGELPQYPKLYTPWGGKASRPLDWVEHNVDTFTNWVRLTKMDDGMVFDLAGELARIETRADFYRWAERAAKAVDDALPANLPTDMRAELTKWFQHPLEAQGRLFVGRTGTDIDGNPMSTNTPIVGRSDPLDPSARPASLPSSPTDFIGDFYLPDVNVMREATSAIEGIVRASANHRLRGAAVKGAFDLVRGIFALGTTLWKAPILALRIVAMTERIQLEQALRAHLYGGYKALTLFPKGLTVTPEFVNGFVNAMGGSYYGGAFEILKPDARYAPFDPPTEQSLGGIHMQLQNDRVGAEYTTVDTTLLNSRRRVPNDGHYTATVETLQKLRNDWFDRRFVQDGMDVEKMLAVAQKDPFFRDYVYRDQLEVLRDSDLAWSAAGEVVADEVMLRRWLENKATALREVFDRAPNAEAAVATGRYGADIPDRTMTSIDPVTGIPNQTILTERTAELLSVRNALDSLKRKERIEGLTEEERVRLVTFERQARDLRTQVSRLGDLTADEVSGGAVSLEDTSAVAALMKKEYAAAKFDFPRELSVKRRYAAHERTGLAEAGAKFRAAWNEAWYAPFRLASAADMKMTRASVYYQMADHYYRGLRLRGYPEAEARAFAQLKAATEVRDLMYDLSARTSMQRGLKDTFWFASAFQEVLYTWLVKIPSQQAFRLGYFTIPAQGKALLNVLRSGGIVQTVSDAQGEREVILAPWLASLIDKIMPGEQAFANRLSFNLTGFNLVTSSPIPGIATLPGWMLGRAANEWGGVFKGLSDIFNQYGSEIQATPRQLTYAWEWLTGDPWPLEWMSPDYAKAQYDRAYDQSLQYAFSQAIGRGDLQPRPEDFTSREAYEAARDAWSKALFQDADTYFKGVAAFRFFGSSSTPASLTVAAEDRAAYQEFLTRVVEPAGGIAPWLDPDTLGGYTEAQKQLLDQYIARHPYSLAYSIGYTVYGEKERELPYESTGDDVFFDEFLTGERRVLSPEEYVQKLMAIESYRFYNGQRNSALQAISKDAPTLLTHGYLRIDALTHFAENYGRYLAYNQDVVEVLDDSKRAWQERYGIPANTYDVSRLADTISYLNQLSPVFTGESGMPAKEFTTVLAELKALYSDTATFGTPTSQLAKDVSWYYDTVLDPYFEKTEALYLEAQDLNSRGEDASAVYDQIRAVNNSFTDAQLTHEGQLFPTPEAVFYGNKNPTSQASAKLNWTTKPPTWLSDFQLDTVGAIPDFDGRDALLSRISSFDADLDRYIQDNDVSYSSKYYDSLQVWADSQRRSIAAEYGDGGVAVYRYYNETPAQRLTETEYGADNTSWQQTLRSATQIATQLTDAGLSPRGYGEAAVQDKIWLYRIVEARRAADSAYNDLWDALSWALPEKGMSQRDGVPLYEAVLFGQFQTDLIDPRIIVAVQQGGG